MQSVSTTWTDLLAAGAAREVRCFINDVEHRRNSLVSARIVRSEMRTLAIGEACAASLDLSFFPHEGEVIPKTAEIRCEVRLRQSREDILVGDDAGNAIATEDGFIIAAQYAVKSEWIPHGTFYIDNRKASKTTGLMTVPAYDRMLFAEALYDDPTGTYPMPMADAVDFIASKLEIEVDPDNEIYDGTIDCPNGIYTMREVLRFIAAASAGNFVISAQGKLRLVPLASPAEDAKECPCRHCEPIGDAVTITGVRLLPDKDTEYFAGNRDGYVITGECAYATQAMCKAVLAKLQGVVYRPFEASDVLLDPALEIGDSVTLGGVTSVLAQQDVILGSAMISDVSAPIEEEIEHEIPYQSRTREQRMTATSFSEIRKTTKEIALSVSGKVDGTTVANMIKTSIEDGITLESTTDGVTGSNSCKLVLKNGEVEIDAIIVKMGNVTVDSISASNVTAGKLNASTIGLSGDLSVYENATATTASGKLGYTGNAMDNSAGMHMSSSNGEVRVTGNGAAMESAGASVICATNVTAKGGHIYFAPTTGNEQKIEVGGNYMAPSVSYGSHLGLENMRWATIYCSAVNDASDRSLKTNIEYCLDKYDAVFNGLRPCSYTFIREGSDGKTNTGFIAQDIDELLGILGMDRKDFAGLAMSNKAGASGLVYNQFIALLVDQVQKLKKREAERDAREQDSEIRLQAVEKALGLR